MRYPDFLKDNDTIGFVAPAFGCATNPYKDAFDSAILQFKEMGYRIDIGANVGKSDGIGISTNPADCGSELTEYYLNEKNNILLSCGGGELMCETIDYVDFDKIKEAKPKWFMGYSDNTNMTFLLATLCDTASVYGPCAPTFGMKPWHPALKDALNVLKGEIKTLRNYDLWEIDSLKNEDNPYEPYNVTMKNSIRTYPESGVKMSGRLLGGCIDCLVNLVGTKYDKVNDFIKKYSEDGIIWYLEACDLNVMSIRRSMWKLDRAGWFDNAKGFIIGRPYLYGQDMMGLDQYEAVMGIVRKYNVPVVMDADVGHLPPMMPLVNGAYANVSASVGNMTVDMEYK